MTHTKTPWSIDSNDLDGTWSIGNIEHDGDDWDVCTVHSTKANAEFIVRAVNNHDALVEELENLKKFIKSYLQFHPETGSPADSFTQKALMLIYPKAKL